MRIGIDARFYRKSTAGLGRYSRALIEQLSQIDQINDYIIYLTPDDIKEYNISAKNFHAKVIPITHYSISEQTKFLHILNQDHLDLVHFLNFNHPIFYKGKFIATIHDLTILFHSSGKSQQSKFKKWAFKKVMGSAIKNSRKIIAISKATKNDVVKVFDAKENKIEVIYEGVDKIYNHHIKQQTAKIAKFRAKYKINQPYLLFLSQWRPHKGLPELIRAYEILRERYKIPHLLVIGGKPNPAFPEIPRSINTSGYNCKIIQPGFIPEEDLPMFYTCADAFIFPSKYEGFGLPPLEAMACGTPVIASNKSCMPEILGTAAEYFNPNKPEEIAKIIKNIITNPAKLKNMSQQGTEQAKKYSWSKMAQETLKIYESIDSHCERP